MWSNCNYYISSITSALTSQKPRILWQYVRGVCNFMQFILWGVHMATQGRMYFPWMIPKYFVWNITKNPCHYSMPRWETHFLTRMGVGWGWGGWGVGGRVGWGRVGGGGWWWGWGGVAVGVAVGMGQVYLDTACFGVVDLPHGDNFYYKTRTQVLTPNIFIHMQNIIWKSPSKSLKKSCWFKK